MHPMTHRIAMAALIGWCVALALLWPHLHGQPSNGVRKVDAGVDAAPDGN